MLSCTEDVKDRECWKDLREEFSRHEQKQGKLFYRRVNEARR